MRTSVMVIDSDQRTATRLNCWISARRQLVSVGTAACLAEARALAARERPEVVFCATELTDGSGFEVSDFLGSSTSVILLATSADQAVRAFEVGALDCLLKPLAEPRFAQSVDRLLRRRPTMRCTSTCEPSVMVNAGDHREFIELRDIVGVSSLGGNYTAAHVRSGPPLEVRRTLDEWEQRLPKDEFIRVHRCAIVCISDVQRIERRTPRTFTVIVGEHALKLPASRRLGTTLLRALNTRALGSPPHAGRSQRATAS